MRPMMAGLLLATGLVAAALGAGASDPLTREFLVPVDRVWMVTLAVLAGQGWGVDDADRTIGAITTKSHRLEREGTGVWSMSTRLRLRLAVIPLAEDRTQVSVESEVFRRERVLWMERDERVKVVDPARADADLEHALLSAIAGAL